MIRKHLSVRLTAINTNLFQIPIASDGVGHENRDFIENFKLYLKEKILFLLRRKLYNFVIRTNKHTQL